MSPKPSTPYFSECPVCGNGLLRFWICVRSREVALLCDECENIWDDVPGYAKDPERKPNYLFPDWPGDNRFKWAKATIEELEETRLTMYVSGESE